MKPIIRRFQCIALFLPIAILMIVAPIAVDAQNQKASDQEKGKSIGDQKSDNNQEEASSIPKAVDFYKGRRVAQTMHYFGAEWLVRDEREREERCSLMLANLGLKKKMTICDMGCGNGYHTLRMAKLIGEEGTVYGVDVQPKMLEFLRDRMEKQGVDNVVPVLGSFHHPRLPSDTFDLILLVDVYHEFSHPEPMLKEMRKALKKNGVIALVEYRLEDPDVPIKLLHKMSKKQIMKEYPANGFKLVREFNKLPWQHLMFFARDDSELKGIKPEPFAEKDGD